MQVSHLRTSGRRNWPKLDAALGLEPVDAALHLLDVDELRPSALFFGMCEEDLWRILA